MAVIILTDRGLQLNRVLGDFDDLAHALRRVRWALPWVRHAQRDLFAGRLTSKLLDEPALDADQLVDRFDHVHRDADGPGLVGDGAGDGLADPPGGVGAELVALAVVELLDRP